MKLTGGPSQGRCYSFELSARFNDYCAKKQRAFGEIPTLLTKNANTDLRLQLYVVL